jgi:oxygen-independent coproporphyrinogen-3 oxidase
MPRHHEVLNKLSRFTRLPAAAAEGDASPPRGHTPPSPATAAAAPQAGPLLERLRAALAVHHDVYPCFDWTFPPPIRQRATGEIAAERLFEYPSAIPGRYSIYLHIPFCQSLCRFCYYTVIPGRGEADMARYLEALLVEMRLYSGVLSHAVCESVYVGGGTPSLLPPDQLDRLFEGLHRHFRIAPEAEITLESAPGTLDAAKLDCLVRLGITRLSYGIQSLDEALLAQYNRHYAVPAARAEIARALARFPNFNVDTMYGFPGEDEGALIATLEALLALGVPSVSIYALDRQRCDFESRKDRPRADAEAASKAARFAEARGLLEARGFRQILQNIFLDPRRASYRHQLRRWENLPLVALGLSAMGYAPRRPYRNTHSLKLYYERLASGRLPVTEWEDLDATLELMREAVSLLRFAELDLARIQDKYGVDLEAVFRELIAALGALGLIERTGTRLRLSEAALPYNDLVPMLFAPDDFKQLVFELPEEYRAHFPLPALLARVGQTQSQPFPPVAARRDPTPARAPAESEQRTLVSERSL